MKMDPNKYFMIIILFVNMFFARYALPFSKMKFNSGLFFFKPLTYFVGIVVQRLKLAFGYSDVNRMTE